MSFAETAITPVYASGGSGTSMRVQRRTPVSIGRAAATYTLNTKVVAVLGTLNFHVFAAEVACGCTIWPYRKYGWLAAVKVPSPSGFCTSTVPEPTVTVGSWWKNTFTPLTVVPLGVPIGCEIRFCTVTSACRVLVAGL